jgi:U6 snRNA-associated Sm-like protein LSm3
MTAAVSEPLDIIKQNLDEQIYVKLRGYREMVGKLHAYDSHCNMVLGDVVEKIFELTDDNNELKSREEKHTLVFVRGDSVILVTDATNV